MPHEDHEAGQRKDGRSKPKHAPDHQRAAWRFLAASACLRNSSAASFVVRAISLRIALRSRLHLPLPAAPWRLRKGKRTCGQAPRLSWASTVAREIPVHRHSRLRMRILVETKWGLDYLIREFRMRAVSQRLQSRRGYLPETGCRGVHPAYNNENWASRAPLRIRAGARVSLCNWHASGSPFASNKLA